MRDAIEVIVVDNGSTDASLRILENYKGFVTLALNPTNLGFAEACNQGIGQSQGEFIALLNNDTRVEPRWLEELVAVLVANPRAGCCTSKILCHSRPDVLDSAGLAIYPDGSARGRGRLERDLGQFEQVEEVFCPSGCATLLRREMLDDVGLFDEHFFAYCEDTDIGFRARLRGWSCLYAPRSIVYHKFSASSGAFSAFKALQVERNRVWVALKNLPLPLLILSPAYTLLRYLWKAYAILTKRGASWRFLENASFGEALRVLFSAYWQAFRPLRRLLRQRRQIQSRRRVSTLEVWSWMRRFKIGARELALLE